MVAVFTVYFEDPFWVGLLESEEGGELVVARQVFGAEPSNAELLHFMLYRFADLPRSRSSSAEPSSAGCRMNPKRAAREARRAQARPPSTKAQAALSTALEKGASERKLISREERRAQAERRFELRAEKRRRRQAGH
jgi:hypothetical protein